MLRARLCATAGAALLVVAAAPAVSQTAAVAAEVVQLHPTEVHVADALPAPPTTSYCEAHYQIACYQAGQVRTAYDLGPLAAKGIDGRGQTIVIVDSYGSPTIGHDLAVFDAAFNLPAPPALTVIQPAGPVPPYHPNANRAGWAGETDLDVEYSHAMAPGASILLVETPTSENEGTSGFSQIETAEEYVINHHLGGVISQSFSATEQTFPTAQSLLALRGAYFDAAENNVTVLTASGDSGAADVAVNGDYYLNRVTSWPDSDPLVTGVGGTQMSLNAGGGHVAPDVVWNDTYNVPTQRYIFGNKGPNPLAGGGGQSIIFNRPAYQNGVSGVVGPRRGVPDISMSGACDGAVDMYQSFAGQPVGWYPTCGTSEATPLFAGIVALAEQAAGHTLGLINPALYRLSSTHAPGIVDVTSGNNTVSFDQDGARHTVGGFPATVGYDLSSGVGTVNAAVFVPELARAAG